MRRNHPAGRREGGEEEGDLIDGRKDLAEVLHGGKGQKGFQSCWMSRCDIDRVTANRSRA